MKCKIRRFNYFKSFFIFQFQVELAFFTSLRENPRIEFISVPQHRTGAILVVLAMFFQMAVSISKHLTDVFDVNKGKKSGMTRNIIELGMLVLLEGLLIFFGRQYFKSLDELARAQKEFDVRKCECSVEHDHPMLLEEINLFMASSSSAHDGIERFNRLVKRNLKIYAPFKGVRSVFVVSYIPCFILGGLLHVRWWLSIVDDWAGGKIWGYKGGYTVAFKYIAYYVYVGLVAFPMLIYLFLVMLKFMWWVETSIFRLRNPVLIVFLYLAFLAFDVFVPVRMWILVNCFKNVAKVFVNNWIYAFQASPFGLMPQFFVMPHPHGLGWDNWKMLWYPNQYEVPVWGRVFVIMWIVVSSIGTYWLFESAYLQSMRLRIWGWIRKRIWC